MAVSIVRGFGSYASDVGREVVTDFFVLFAPDVGYPWGGYNLSISFVATVHDDR